MEPFIEVMGLLDELINDFAVSKSVKRTMTEVNQILNDECELRIRCDRAIQSIGMAEDPNVDPFTKTRIWSLLSMLESLASL
ncbi:MAG: UPF0147 family protein [Candidatus Nanoarchaeia archaeon]|jgi:uncharacterized protein (UPF0147 family)